MTASSVDSPRSSVKYIEPVDRSSLQFRIRHTLFLLRRSPVAILGVFIVSVVILLAIFGPLISPHDPTNRNLRSRFEPPGYTNENGTFLLGTDQLGRDILSRIIAGSRVSVIVGIVAVLISGSIGVIYRMSAGYLGNRVATVLMRVADAFLAIPFIILVVAISGVVGAGLTTLILILGLTGWVIYARVVRGEVLVVRELDYVVAARVIGQPEHKIMIRQILPNVLASSIVLAALQVSTTILAESSLSFLGLGVQPPTITWGLMLADGRQYIGSAWWMTTFPGLAITITVLGIVFFGDWLRDVLDPRLRGRN
jgi:peptide/nickel transport system permease protein